MTCYLRLHEVAVAVHPAPGTSVDWAEVARLWQEADGVGGRDAALDAMPVTLVELDDLPTTDLTGMAGIVLSGRADQRLLAGMADRVEELLGGGGVVVYSGQLRSGWLPGLAPFESAADPGPAGPPVLGDHPVLRGLAPPDLGPGFLNHTGGHAPPQGAQVIARTAAGTPGTYVAAVAGGTVLLHGGHDLLAYGTGQNTERLVPQLIEWVAQQGSP